MVIFVLQTRWGMRKAKKWGNKMEAFASGLFGRSPSTNTGQRTSDYGKLRDPSTPNGREESDDRRASRRMPTLGDKRTFSTSSRLSTRPSAKSGGSRRGLLPQHQIRGSGTRTTIGRVGGFFTSMVARDRWSWLIWWKKKKEKTEDLATANEASIEQV